MDSNLNSQDLRAALIENVANLKEKEVMDIVSARIANGDNPLTIVEDCREGLRIVGERYEQREYYLSGLIMAGEIFREVMQLLEPIITEAYQGNELGTILLGTVEGDIHDIGKNAFSMLLTSYGFTVNDLGVNVPADEFVHQATLVKPDIIGLSGLLTSSYDSMKETIRKIRTQAQPPASQTPIAIGGSTINQQVCDYVKADYWANDAMMGVRLFIDILNKKTSQSGGS